jgi:hypothetical protein
MGRGSSGKDIGVVFSHFSRARLEAFLFMLNSDGRFNK